MSKVDDFDVLVQDGMIGLGEACRRFDTTRGIKFITYATQWVRKYILAHFDKRNLKFENSKISIDSPMMANNQKNANGNETTFENYLDEYCEPTCERPKTATEILSANEQIEICQQLYSAIKDDSSLSSMDKAVFTDLFQHREKTRNVAEKYNIEMSEVNDIKHRVLDKMRGLMHTRFNINSFSDIYGI